MPSACNCLDAFRLWEPGLALIFRMDLPLMRTGTRFFVRYRTFLKTIVDILFTSVLDLDPTLFCSGFQDDKQQIGVFSPSFLLYS